MITLAIICQIVVALGIFNVWLVRRDRPTPYRPEGAANIEEEFRRYGLPGWAWIAVGAAKVFLAILLLVGVFVPSIAPVAGGAMAVLMISAIAAHVRVNDPLVKSVPAFLMLLLSTVVVVAYTV
jgi:uncharacterized membrane protein YphA (DoxX/SURF4 family)